MIILFYGHKGWIGSQLVKQWSALFPDDTLVFSNTRLEVNNLDQIENEIKSADRVFSTVGRTSGNNINNIDYLEDHLEENIRDNLYCPMLLALLCKKHNKHLSYLGTGCIFSRNTRENDYIYTELDTPDFTGSGYSTVKGFTDNLTKMFDNVLNLRIRMPITGDWHSKNFITKIVGFKNICSYPNSMTYMPDMIPYMIHMSRDNVTGTYNMVNDNPISHEEILEMYKTQVKPLHTYNLIEQTELELKAKRSNNVLSCDKLKKLFKVRTIHECIKEALESMK